MLLRERSRHVALRVCFIQSLIQDGIIKNKQCPTAVQMTKALPREPFGPFINHLLGDKHVGKWFVSGPSYARLSAQVFNLFLLVSIVYVLCHLIHMLCLLYYRLYVFLEHLSKGDAFVLEFSVVNVCILCTCLSLKHVICRIPLTIWGRGSIGVILYVDRDSCQSWLGLTY